ncbi:hypothetical protein MNBD_GAMMA15-2548 [hydrothermal vent metagenome]|uniref:HMA domain-containing protein n=1 Tax=hydrothermal vent metagenome TaxID=652676 RepID=A0A3B0YZ44_9ZZZZ
MIRNLLLTLTILVWSTNGWAKDFNYQADVKGMVCAFCAYSVNKKISTLPGVDAESVDVDLKSGRVVFSSEQKVSRESLEAVFTDSGFRLEKLSEVERPPASGQSLERPALVLDMKLYSLDTVQFESVFEAIGNIAAGNQSRLLIEAPALLEDDLLKPVLMGRQQVMKVRFMPSSTDAIHLQLYLR